MYRLSMLIFILACMPFSLACAGETSIAQQGASIEKFQRESALKASQDAIGRLLSNHRLLRSDGKGMTMHEFRGKPLVLSLIYTSCYHTCPATTRFLASVVEKARDALGKDKFSVAILGFDSQFDNPQAMKHFAKRQGIDNSDWVLLSADSDTVNALSEELGFLFYTSPNGFDHLVQATIVDRDGRIYRQVYGEVFDTPLLVEPLKELVLGRPQPNQTLLSDLVNKVRFFCTTYDPASDAYHFDYSLFVGMVIGALVILLGTGFLIREYMHGRRPPMA